VGTDNEMDAGANEEHVSTDKCLSLTNEYISRKWTGRKYNIFLRNILFGYRI
jgi:hypothetical protein